MGRRRVITPELEASVYRLKVEEKKGWGEIVKATGQRYGTVRKAFYQALRQRGVTGPSGSSGPTGDGGGSASVGGAAAGPVGSGTTPDAPSGSTGSG